MRFSAVLLFTASIASASIILKRQTGVPTCAQTCQASTDPSPCAVNDLVCQCLNINYITQLANCVGGSCSAEDAQAAQMYAVAACQEAGVDLISPLPTCASACGNDTSATGCAAEDGACLCNNTAYIQSVDSCFKSSCTGDDLTTAENVGKGLCRAYGVDISPTVGAA